MQFLLVAVNAKYIHTNPALYSLRAYAGKELIPFVSMAEYTINNRVEEVLGSLYLKDPDVIGFSCYIWNFHFIQELLRELPKVLPETEIWLGGPEVSFDGQEALKKFPMVRGIMAGEGEQTFKDLLSFYVAKDHPKMKSGYGNLLEIPGLVLPEGSSLARTPLDFSTVPFPYDDLGEFKNKIIYYESSRGCPFRCSYCLSSIDKTVRFRDMELVMRELQYFLDHNVPQVKFIDRTFNCSRSRALEIWKYLADHDNGITNFHFEIAAELLGREELELLKIMRPGLLQLEIGVQTTNPETLRKINRPADPEKIAGIVKEIKSGENIHVHLDLIAGLPYEGYDSFGRSFDCVYRMTPHQLQLGFLKVLKGTAIWEQAEAYGIVYGDRMPYEVLYTKWLSYGEVLKLKRIEEMVELYYNSNQFVYTLSALEREFSAPFAMFEELAAYYEKNGYLVNSPARSYRYQVLLDFVKDRIPEKTELFKELLTFDLYLRENAKSRPSFARDLLPWREKIWQFYCGEEEKPDLLAAYSDYHARQTMKMTHMEGFYYPVWEACKEMELIRGKEPGFVLFDYKKRDALTGAAAVYVL
ncbi:MAG: B12-binding domain-containing radical SAM protein [Lachnospiraceae bacterium]|nr:B12-binding domain-containing radical SAM protein [Lachnospiraceae bacterium]